MDRLGTFGVARVSGQSRAGDERDKKPAFPGRCGLPTAKSGRFHRGYGPQAGLLRAQARGSGWYPGAEGSSITASDTPGLNFWTGCPKLTRLHGNVGNSTANHVC